MLGSVENLEEDLGTRLRKQTSKQGTLQREPQPERVLEGDC